MTEKGPVFHLGYHKTGTSWLQAVYFGKHPEISALHNPFKPWTDPLLSYLVLTPERLFDPAELRARYREGPGVNVISSERLAGHPSSGGYDGIQIAQRIHAAFPNARILCLIRNQLEMIPSFYKQIVRAGYPGTLRQWLLAPLPWRFPAFDFSVYEYDHLIQTYRSHFGPDNVCFIAYELMRFEPERFLRVLRDFLQLSADGPSPTEEVNPSLPDTTIGAHRLLNHWRSSEFNPLPPWNMPEPMRKSLLKVALHLPLKVFSLPPDLRDLIAERYALPNQRLNNLNVHGLDLYLQRMQAASQKRDD